MGSLSVQTEPGWLHPCYNGPYLTEGLVFSRAKTPFSHGQLGGCWKPLCDALALWSQQMKGNRGALTLPHYCSMHLLELRKNGVNTKHRKGKKKTLTGREQWSLVSGFSQVKYLLLLVWRLKLNCEKSHKSRFPLLCTMDFDSHLTWNYKCKTSSQYK